jgi:CHAT domain-containing protein/lipopolysaccharide biosynthesis regulator YciM
MKRSACWFVLSFLCCCAVSCAADSAAVQAVRTCGYEGERLYKNGSFNAARLQWEKGLELARGMKNAELVDHFQTNLGIVYAELGEYKKAIGCFERSLVTARARNDLPVVAATLGSLGNAAASLGDYKQALTSYEASLAQFRSLNDTPNIATALSNIGNVHARQADFAAAGRYYEEALRLARELNDQTGKGNNLANLGNVYAKLGDYEKALYFSGEAQKIFEEQNYRPGLAACATNLGVIYNDLGDYRRALLHYEEALKLAKLLGNRDASANALLNLGTVYRNIGDYRQAISCHLRSLALFRDTENRQKIMEALTGMSAVFAELGDHRRALSYCEESLKIAESLENKQGIAANLGRIGNIHAARGEYDAAIDHYARALDIRRQAALPTDELEAAIADVCLERGNLAAAEDAYLRLKDPVRLGRLHLQKKDFNSAVGCFSRSLETDMQNREAKYLFADYCGLGQGYLGLWEYDKAQEQYDRAITLAEEQREALGDGERAQFFAAKICGFGRTEPYEGMVRTLAGIRDFDGAFYYSENLKGRLLAESIARGQSDAAKGIPEALAKTEDELTVKLRSLRKEMESLYRHGATDRYAEKEKELRKAKADLERFVRKLRQACPAYASAKYPQPLKPQEIALQPDEVLVEYEVTYDRTYLFILKGQDRSLTVKVAAKPRALLQELVQKYRGCFNGINKPSDLAAYDFRSGKELYDILFAPVVSELPDKASVIIVPDEMLGMLPFEALVMSAAEKEQLGDGARGPFPLGVAYLGDRYAIAYAQSATSLTMLRSLKTGRAAAAKALAICDPVFSADDPRSGGVKQKSEVEDLFRLMGAVRDWKRMGVAGTKERGADPERTAVGGKDCFPRLEKTAEIGRNLSALFGASATVLNGSDAREENVVNLDFSQYRYIAFGTHGILDDTVPWVQQPALVLSQVGNREPFDGFLTMTEVMGLKIPAEVVALTACDTGVGKNVSGEGVMGMGKAFQFAGAGSVLMSLWPVAEEATVELSNAFFKSLKDGKEPKDALRLARETLRRNGYEHPFFWAAFILVTQ